MDKDAFIFLKTSEGAPSEQEGEIHLQRERWEVSGVTQLGVNVPFRGAIQANEKYFHLCWVVQFSPLIKTACALDIENRRTLLHGQAAKKWTKTCLFYK